MRKFLGLTRSVRLLACLGLVAMAATSMAFSDDEKKEITGDVWPLATCPVSGEALGSMGDAIVYNHKGREIRFCCKSCVKGFKKDAKEFLAKADKEIIKQQLPYYPIDTCLVMTDESLVASEDMEPVNIVYHNRLVRFCCKGCVRKFKKDSTAYLAALDKAVIAKQMESYPLDYCVVEPTASIDGDDTVNFVFANRLVRLGGEGCITEFNNNPAKYLAMIDEAAKKKD